MKIQRYSLPPVANIEKVRHRSLTNVYMACLYSCHQQHANTSYHMVACVLLNRYIDWVHHDGSIDSALTNPHQNALSHLTFRGCHQVGQVMISR